MLIYRVQRIPRSSVIFKRDDAPSSVSNLVQIEYLRTCSIAHLSQPTTGYQPGWGSPGTRFSGINFKRSFLDTVDQIDSAARDILPSLPPLPHPFRLSAHLAPLLRILPEGAPLAHQIDSLLQIVFYAGEEDENEFFNLDASKTGYFASISHNNGYYKDENTDQRVSGEMTLQEYERGMKAAAELLDLLEDEKRALESDFSDHMSNTHSGAISRGSSARRRRASVAYDDEGQPISWRRRSRSDVYGIEKPDHQDARIPYASRSDEDFQFGR
ncbi:hypothetical protein FRB91_007365 [Serendipita sp. 411]|nr:hypothetical protein FRB91_007365 [Serendipita sp. 411]